MENEGRKATWRRCGSCGAEGRDLYLHHGQLCCGLHLVALEEDEMMVKLRILEIHSHEVWSRSAEGRKRRHG